MPTGVLVDEQLLLDAPPSVGAAAARAGTDLTRVHTIAVTHAHSDHWDPSLLLHHSWMFPDTPLRIIGPSRVIEQAQQWLPPGRNDELVTVVAGMSLDLGDHVVTALPSTHGRGSADALADETVLYSVTTRDGASLLYATDTGPAGPDLLDAVRGASFDLVLAELTFGAEGPRTCGHLDHDTFPVFIDELRRVGAVSGVTDVVAVHIGHHNPAADLLTARLHEWGAHMVADGTTITIGATAPADLVFVTGGARSGKSDFAEQLAGRTGQPVTYVATGWPGDLDPGWQARVSAHQSRRPAHWRTVETLDLPAVLAEVPRGDVVLIDCLSAWVTRLVDNDDLWGDPQLAHKLLATATDALLDSLRATSANRVIVVSNEVGSGVVPSTAVGGLFRDLLGRVNTAVATACDRAVLMVAGRALELTS